MKSQKLQNNFFIKGNCPDFSSSRSESRNRACSIFYQIVNISIRLMVGVAVFGLFLHSIFSTSFIGIVTGEDGSWWERTLNIRDYPVRHLLVFILFTAVMVTVRRLHGYIVKKHPKYALFTQDNRKILKILFVAWFTVGCGWVLVTQLTPGSDPAKIYAIAMQWRQKNFSSFAEGGYMFRYPFQSGIVLFYYFLSFIFGSGNYVGPQIVNVVALAFVYFFLVRLAAVYWQEDKQIKPAVCIGLMLWAPFFFYITYLYGILIGMACSLGAFYAAVKYLETRKYRYMVIAVIAIGIATVLKTNCLIYAIAICCFLTYDIIVTTYQNKLKSMFFILLIVMSIVCCNQVTNRYVEHLSGYEMPDGEVMVSWVVMGLQEAPFAPGTYNGYIGDVFKMYHYDTEQITEASIADIKKILKRMAKNPLDDGIPFFASKTAFQWNDPTFIGMHISDNRPSAATLPSFAQSIINGNGRIVLSVILNYVQTLIWTGALYCLFARRLSKNIYELIGAVIFLGGYLFHFFWESSTSYTIPYFVILIPYAVKGYMDMVRGLDGFAAGFMARRANGEKIFAWRPKRNDIILIVLSVMMITLLAAFTRTNLFIRTLGLDDGSEAVEQFYGRNRAWSFIPGKEIVSEYYLISPYLDKTQALVQQEDGIQTEDNAGEKERRILVSTQENSTTFRFRDTEKVMAVSENDPERPVGYMDDASNMYYEPDYAMQTKWVMQETDGGTYYILLGGQALTWQDGLVVMQMFEGTDEQKWVFN